MKAIATEDTNLTLTMKGAMDLPAERCSFIDPQTGKANGNGYETVWEPDVGERRALANGAPILLRLWGDAHPPVSVAVGEPGEEVERQVSQTHAIMALGYLAQSLENRGEATVQDTDPPLKLVAMPEPQELLGLWEEALDATRRAAIAAESHAAKLRAASEGAAKL